MACAAAAVGAGAAVLHSPLLAVHRVEVTGNRHTPRALVLAAAGLSGRRGPVPMVDVGGPVARKAVEALPWVLSASFHLSWPWTVIVKVRERAPAALVRTASGTCLVDAKGRVLEVLGTGGRPPAVPVVEGAVGAPPGEAVRPARRLSQAELADLLKAAASSPSGLSRRGLELTWGPGGLVAYAGPARTPVLLGPPTELAFKLEVLAELEAAVPLRSYAEADLSVPERPALTPKP
jgi:cell division septal protein FtsQ